MRGIEGGQLASQSQFVQAFNDVPGNISAPSTNNVNNPSGTVDANVVSGPPNKLEAPNQEVKEASKTQVSEKGLQEANSKLLQPEDNLQSTSLKDAQKEVADMKPVSGADAAEKTTVKELNGNDLSKEIARLLKEGYKVTIQHESGEKERITEVDKNDPMTFKTELTDVDGKITPSTFKLDPNEIYCVSNIPDVKPQQAADSSSNQEVVIKVPGNKGDAQQVADSSSNKEITIKVAENKGDDKLKLKQETLRPRAKTETQKIEENALNVDNGNKAKGADRLLEGLALAKRQQKKGLEGENVQQAKSRTQQINVSSLDKLQKSEQKIQQSQNIENEDDENLGVLEEEKPLRDVKQTNDVQDVQSTGVEQEDEVADMIYILDQYIGSLIPDSIKTLEGSGSSGEKADAEKVAALKDACNKLKGSNIKEGLQDVYDRFDTIDYEDYEKIQSVCLQQRDAFLEMSASMEEGSQDRAKIAATLLCSIANFVQKANVESNDAIYGGSVVTMAKAVQNDLAGIFGLKVDE